MSAVTGGARMEDIYTEREGIEVRFTPAIASSPTFSPATQTTKPPPTSGLAAPRPSPHGPTSLAWPWRHDDPYRRHRSAHRTLCQSVNAKLTVPPGQRLPALV